MENISYGGKSEIPEIRDSRDKKITRVTAHSLTGPSSLTDTVDDTGHMPRKSCPPLVYLNLRPPGLSRCTVRLPILDWGRRRPTQRNHLPKKTHSCKCSSKKVRKRSFELLRNEMDWLRKIDPDWRQSICCWLFLLSSKPARAAACAAVGESR